MQSPNCKRKRTGGRDPSEHRTGVTSADVQVQLLSLSRDRGSVFRASTSAEIANVFSGLKNWRECNLLGAGKLAMDVLDFLLHPPDAADFNLAVWSDQEQSRNVGQAVSIRDRVVSWDRQAE